MPVFIFRNPEGKVLYKATVHAFIPMGRGQEKKAALAILPVFLKDELKEQTYSVEMKIGANTVILTHDDISPLTASS